MTIAVFISHPLTPPWIPNEKYYIQTSFRAHHLASAAPVLVVSGDPVGCLQRRKPGEVFAMQNFIISLKIPSTISFEIIQSLDKKMEALHFTRVRFAWGADGPADVATYEGRSDSSADELSSRMRTSIVEGFPEVKMLIEMVA